MFSYTTSSPSHNDSTITDLNTNTKLLSFAFANATFLVVLSPLAVAGNALSLAAIWKKTFARTPFHILLSGLAFTDLCKGVIAQPFYAAATFMYVANPRVEHDMPVLYIALNTTGDSSAIYFISLIHVHWTMAAHVSSIFGDIAMWIFYRYHTLNLVIPIPAVVYRVLVNEIEIFTANIYIMTIILMVSCYVTTSIAYFKVYRIIRHHQQQV